MMTPLTVKEFVALLTACYDPDDCVVVDNGDGTFGYPGLGTRKGNKITLAHAHAAVGKFRSSVDPVYVRNGDPEANEDYGVFTAVVVHAMGRDPLSDLEYERVRR